MTYCVGVLLEDGLVFTADRRTSAGVDHISSFRKIAVFEQAEDRVMVLLSAGNLATTQSVVSVVSERLGEREGDESLFQTTTMFNAARIVGQALREVVERDGPAVRAEEGDVNANFIFGGQIRGRPHRLFHIYNAGNFIEATPETPYFQIGEVKFGKPILDRTLSHTMSLAAAAKGALLSYDSTMRSNLSVAPPIDVLVYRADSFVAGEYRSIEFDDPYFTLIRDRYGKGIADLFDGLPDPDWIG